MRIRKLEIQGFKSFADRTAFHFGPGISGVVGSNGCGKSNVVDAVKWCLGEQSAKSLRGNNMGDVIFNGTQVRSATSLAEVSLTFVADDVPFPGEFARYEEVQITRRLFRDGNSEYLINQQRSRLRDIQDLFLDTGVNNRMYSFIEQGRIGQIVNARPEHRRALFEEAAGISRFKSRRDDAVVKLAETETNLERASDIVDDLNRRLRSLTRQVERAGRYRRLHSRIKQAEIFLSFARYSALKDDEYILSAELQNAIETEGRLGRELAGQEASLQERRAALRVLEASVGQLRDELATLEADRREHESARVHQERECARLRTRLVGLGQQLTEQEAIKLATQTELVTTTAERSEVEGRFGSIDQELRDARETSNSLSAAIRDRQKTIDTLKSEQLRLVSRISGHKAALESASERRSDLERRRTQIRDQAAETSGQDDRLADQMAEAADRITDAEAAVADGKDEIETARVAVSEAEAERRDASRALKQAEKALTRAEREDSKKRARLDSLRALQDAHEGVEDDVRAALAVDGVRGTLAELLDVPVELERTLAVALGAGLDAIIADNDAAALAAAHAAKGRATIFSIEGLPPTPPAEGLAALVGGALPGRIALAALLGHCRTASSLAEALAVHRETGDRVVVTGDAHAVITPAGEIIVGEPRAAGTAILARRRQIAALEVECDASHAACATARDAVDAASEELVRTEEGLAAAQDDTEEARSKNAEAVMMLRSAKQARDELLREQARQASAAQKVATELQDVERALRAHDENVRRREDGIADDIERQEEVEEELSDNQAELVEEREEADAAVEALNALAAEAGGLREKLRGLQRAESTAQATLENATRQISALTQEQHNATKLVQDMERDDRERTVLLQSIGERQGTLHTSLETGNKQVRSERDALQVVEQQLKGNRDALAAAKEERVEIDQQLGQVKGEVGRIQETLDEKHKISVQQLQQRLERAGHITIMADKSAMTDRIPGAAELSAKEQAYLEDLRVTTERMQDEALVQQWVMFLENDRAALGRLGEVNLIALQEYKEVAERYETLCSQREDLLTSIRTIQQTIAKLNRLCRERFRETFDVVDERFREIYPRLVGGGSARLQLTDEEDLLETGVEIYAQPPGKKLQSLSLLSGGETAMVAIALIFSLFHVKPSPFCLLDEVDAPLDEGNGARFNQMLQEMARKSQFIIITHNKKTMECADTLYGVTMDPPGVSTIVSVSLD